MNENDPVIPFHADLMDQIHELRVTAVNIADHDGPGHDQDLIAGQLLQIDEQFMNWRLRFNKTLLFHEFLTFLSHSCQI